MTINYDTKGTPDVDVNLFDFTGRSVRTEHFTSVVGHNEHRIDISPVLNGVYLVQVETLAGIKTKPVVIMNDY
jgi:hypothetical protein